ncbi:MAG: Ig-like domain-containing protein, partial [Chitinivibrionales bacterium]|nr:Ig-like domain-containing protein [Chitinivibrionales bacterium]
MTFQSVKNNAYTFIALFIGILGCAHQIPPAGGPTDIAAPFLHSATPPPGSNSIDVHTTIRFDYSEWINEVTAKKSIALFPPLPDGYTLKLEGKSIFLIPRTAFEDSTTYHISITKELQDLHGVNTTAAYQYIFSTGKKLDSGKVFGCLIGLSPNATQVKVGLYRHHDSQAGNDSLFLTSPSYCTQADSSGSFLINHVRPGVYTCFAFTDLDNSFSVQPGKEAAFCPAEKLFTCSTTVGPVLLYPAISDTAAAKIVAIKVITPRLLMGQWDNDSSSRQSLVTRDVTLRSQKSTAVSAPSRKTAPLQQSRTLDSIPLFALTPVKGTTLFLMHLADSLRIGQYSLSYMRHRAVARNNIRPFVIDTMLFNATPELDTIKPMIKQVWPHFAAPLSTHIRILWSEPVICRLSRFLL